jgi:hypothetical protein
VPTGACGGVVVSQHTVFVHNTRTIAIVCDDGSMASCEAPRLRAPRSVPRWWPSPTSRPSPPASPRAHAPRSAPPPAARPARTPSTCGRARPIITEASARHARPQPPQPPQPPQATQATQPPQTPQTPQTPQPPPTPQATQCGAHLRVDGRRLDQPAGVGAGAQLQLRSGGHEQPVSATGRRHAGVNAGASQHTAQAHLLPVAAKAEAVLDLVAQRHRQTGLLLQHPTTHPQPRPAHNTRWACVWRTWRQQMVMPPAKPWLCSHVHTLVKPLALATMRGSRKDGAVATPAPRRAWSASTARRPPVQAFPSSIFRDTNRCNRSKAPSKCTGKDGNA